MKNSSQPRSEERTALQLGADPWRLTTGKEVIMEKMLTDEEIVKAWEICLGDDNAGCIQCPYGQKKISCVVDGRHYKDTLDLINRQKAEIERLTEELATYIRKAGFYYKKCKEYGIECLLDNDLEVD